MRADVPGTLERERLRRTVLAFLEAPASDATGETTGGVTSPLHDDAAATAESRERLARTAEQRIWIAEDAARAALARDVRAYARALRDGGMGARRVLRVVGDVVRDASASSLGAVPLGALLHDVGRCCVEAYFAP